ncbi:MAG: cupin domain-containing protein [Proteobacteria bacterium]|nr:cupin domain-containing protein [Pseudomonadota bacterium]MBU1742840.1 cupin domain-containing protein [Pseudomonadota bacterium]
MNKKAVSAREPRFIDVERTVYPDQRGRAAFPWDELPERPRLEPASLHVVRTEPGFVRGNHHHPAAGEWLYVFHGQAELHWADDQGRRRSRLLSGHQTLVYLPAGLPHALVATGPESMWLLAVRDEPPGPSAEHTLPQTVIPGPD